jgi:hypothetical protein
VRKKNRSMDAERKAVGPVQSTPSRLWLVLSVWESRVLGLVLATASYMSWTSWPLAGVSLAERTAGVAGFALLVILIGRFRYFIETLSTRTFLGCAVLGIVGVRLAWIAAADTLPASDFGFYHRAATQIAAGDLRMPGVSEGGFPLLLGLAYRLFGVDLMVAKTLNVVASAATGLLLYRLTSDLVGARAARVTVLLFAIWPAQVMMTSVVATETPYIVFLLFGLAVLVRWRRADHRPLSLLVAGVALGLSALVRPTSFVVFGLAAAWILFGYGMTRTRSAGTAALAMGFVAAIVVARLITGPAPAGTGVLSYLAYNVLTGSNSKSHGMWNEDDEARLGQILRERGSDAVPAAVYHIVAERITSDPGRFARLMPEKFELMWADDLYGAYWSTAMMAPGAATTFLRSHLETLYLVSQFFYSGVLALALFGCIRWRGEQFPWGNSLMFAIVLTFAGLHFILEVQPRYHHPWALAFLILSGYGVCEPSIHRRSSMGSLSQRSDRGALG